MYVQMSLDPHHVAAFENMRRAMKAPSRVSSAPAAVVSSQRKKLGLESKKEQKQKKEE